MKIDKIAWFALLLWFFVSPVMLAEEKTRMMFVLDASGSMWGRVEGKPKIDIARSVMGELLEKTDTSTQMGLTVYGHRKKSDCNDIEVLVPLGGSSTDIMQAIETIQPKGKTPLSAAIKQTADLMHYKQQRSTIILISDGLETCDLDPCQVAAELSMSGSDFTTHVIGFDVKEEEHVGLQCLARNTGGLFLPANDAKSLGAALNKTVEAAKEVVTDASEVPGEVELISPQEVQAGSKFLVEWNGPDNHSDWVTIVKPEAHTLAYNSYAYTKYGSPLELLAPDQAGTYQLRYIFSRGSQVLATQKVVVTPAQATLKIPSVQAAGSSFLVDWTGPNNQADFITVVPVHASAHDYMSYQYTSKGSPLELIAPDTAGEYEVRYIMSQSRHVLAAQRITVSAVGAVLEVPNSVEIGQAFEVKWTGPNNRGDYITIVKKGAPQGTYKSYQYTSKGNPVRLEAAGQVGEYEVRYVQGQSQSTLTKSLIALKSVSAVVKGPEQLSLNQKFKVNWKGPNNNRDYITIVKKSLGDSYYGYYAYTRNGDPADMVAPSEPGAYEIRYVLGGPKLVVARQTVTVK